MRTFQVVIEELALASHLIPSRLTATKNSSSARATTMPEPDRVPFDLKNPCAQDATDMYWMTATTSIEAVAGAWM